MIVINIVDCILTVKNNYISLLMNKHEASKNRYHSMQ